MDLARREGIDLLTYDVQDTEETLRAHAGRADIVFHLAGVNRPQDPAEFAAGNADLTRRVLSLLRERAEAVPFVLSSSTQALLDNDYGHSKRDAEEAVFDYGRETGAQVFAFRFPGVFGKGCRPFYNSVVATFCHQVAHGLPIRVDDPDREITLLYIDDLLQAFHMILAGDHPALVEGFCEAQPTRTLTLGTLADTLRGFAGFHASLTLSGDLADPWMRKLYATYLSYLPEDGFAVPVLQHTDARGYFAELIRSPHFGQLGVSRTVPGVTRGQHWHHTKVEKFIVVQGEGVIRFRKIGGTQVLSYPVSGARIDVVDIPPGYTHHIENTGDSDLLMIIWASELFDPARPDTYFEEV